MDPIDKKWKSFGFQTKNINGHNIKELKKNLHIDLKKNNKPLVLICHTVMSKGISFAENIPDWHWKGKIPSDTINKMIESMN
tara:strand:+ start:90 stop:335 length:246 start_codon:yes stop_codon:yes gene_type:complete